MTAKPKNFTEALAELERLAGEAGPDLRQKIERELHDLESKIKPGLEDLTSGFSDEFKGGRAKLEKEIGEHPWLTLGIVGALFFILGFIFSNRGRD